MDSISFTCNAVWIENILTKEMVVDILKWLLYVFCSWYRGSKFEHTAEVDGKLDVPVVIVNVKVFFSPFQWNMWEIMSLKYMCSHAVLCLKESRHNIWWQVVKKAYRILWFLCYICWFSVNCISCVLCFLPYVYMFDRVFGRGWIKSGECCCPEGLRWVEKGKECEMLDGLI